MKFSKYGIRVFFIVCWVLVLGLFLWLPTLSSWFWQEERVINLFTWAATIDPQIIKDFEKETGIRVNIIYFESNEELFVKLFTTKGKGYDLIMPSDYLMEKLIKYKLVKSLDKSKLNFWDELNPRLLDHYFDPGNVYSIPYFWSIYGLGIDKKFFNNKQPPSSWDLLFTYPIGKNKVAMLNVAREAMLITAQYLYKSIESINKNRIKEIKNTLIEQRKRVEAYVDADIRSNYLLASQTCPIVVSASPYIAQLMRDDENIDFLIPQEGSFILIDNLVISAASKKEDMVYEFINYLYQPEVVKHHYQNYPFLPVTKNLKELMEENNEPSAIIKAHFDESLQLSFFKNVIPETIANDVWIAIKTS